MNIGITGASGFLGKKMIRDGGVQGHRLIGFSRTPDRPIGGCNEVRLFGPEMNVDGIDALFHLAGDSILGLWTAPKRQRILESRIQGTTWVVEAIRRARSKPSALISASGAAIYGDRGEEVLTEHSATAAKGFLPQVAVAWESAGAKVEGARYVAVRIPLVLGKDGGAIPLLGPIFRLGLGGNMGDGKQWMPWVHTADIAGLFFHALHHPEIEGPLNATAPTPVRNEDFTRIIAQAVKRPAFFHVPAFLLRTLIQEASSLLLDSQKIVPGKALATGYNFRFPVFAEALRDVLG
jgi:uncharacterized protein